MIKGVDMDDTHRYILTSYSGTEMYDQFKKEGRLIEHKDRSITVGLMRYLNLS
jgi:hypothetical protein